MLNVEKICNHLGCTEEELSKQMGVSLEELYKYKNDTLKMSPELLMKLVNETGLLPCDLTQPTDENRISFSSAPKNTWKSAQEAKNSLKEYINDGLIAFENTSEEALKKELRKINDCVKMLRKPKISFAGQSDTGKSTLINTLLNTDKMPAKWTPTTSIAVHIKHIDDRPNFIKENVCIFGQVNNSDWNDLHLDDEKYCNQYMLESGDFSLLELYGTHQGKIDNAKTASSAVVFIDSPLLKDCDILDLPGFAVNDEDDEKHKFYTQNSQTDILIYLSRSNGFLQDGDLQYISECLRHLRPIEENGVNNLEPLENLFIIASQSNAINGGNMTELNEILDRRCLALSSVLCDSITGNDEILSYRSKITGYKYNYQTLRKRFFTFEKNQQRLCKDFLNAFNKTVEKLPQTIQENFCDNMRKLIEESKIILKNKVNEYESVVGSSEKYINLLRSIKDNEPTRKLEQEEKKKAMLSLIETLKKSSVQDIISEYNDITDIDRMTAMMDSFGCKNKKTSKEEFTTYFNNRLKSRIEKIVDSSNEKYKNNLDEYLKDYSLSFENYKFSSDVNLSFDTQGAFQEGLKGLVSIGVAGASAMWLSTSTTAFIATVFGAGLGLTPLLATLGVLGIGFGAIGMTLKSIFKALVWKKDFAKALAKEYNKKDFVGKMKAGMDEYWNNTKDSFLAACDNVEEEWQKKIDEYEHLADEDALPELKNKLEDAKSGLDFYEHIPTEYNN